MNNPPSNSDCIGICLGRSFHCKLLSVALAGLALVMGVNIKSLSSPGWLLLPLGILMMLDASQRVRMLASRFHALELKARIQAASDRDREKIMTEAAFSHAAEKEGIQSILPVLRALASLSVWPYYFALAGGMVGWFLMTADSLSTTPKKQIHTAYPATALGPPRPSPAGSPPGFPGSAPGDVAKPVNSSPTKPGPLPSSFRTNSSQLPPGIKVTPSVGPPLPASLAPRPVPAPAITNPQSPPSASGATPAPAEKSAAPQGPPAPTESKPAGSKPDIKQP